MLGFAALYPTYVTFSSRVISHVGWVERSETQQHHSWLKYANNISPDSSKRKYFDWLGNKKYRSKRLHNSSNLFLNDFGVVFLTPVVLNMA